MKKFLSLLLLCLSLFSAFHFCEAAIDPNKLLTVDQAFQVGSKSINAKNFALEWKIADGYHLYSDAISVKVLSPDTVQLAKLKLPKGKKGDDPTRGDYMEYYHFVSVPVRLTRGSLDHLKIQVSYQGCADAGLCFPPQNKTLDVNAPPSQQTKVAAPEPAATNPFVKIDVPPSDLHQIIHDSSNANSVTHLLQQQSEWVVLLSFFVFGLLLAFTPCVFPMLPILSGIIAGQGKHLTSQRAFLLSSVYVLSSALTYALAGIFAGLAGQRLQTMLQNNWVIAISGFIFIILSFSLFGFYNLQLPHHLQTKLTHISHHKGRSPWLSTAIMGIFSTLIVSPCVSAPLVGALAYIGQTGSAWLGGTALFVMGLGMGLPLLVVGTSAGKLLPKAGGWMGGIKNFFGVMLIAMAIWLWSRILPTSVILALSGTLAIICAVYLGALDATPQGWPRLWKAIGIIIGLYGICLFVGCVSGSDNFLQPLDKLSAAKSNEICAPTENVTFKNIHSLTELNSALQYSGASLVDFYADWCISCKEMDRNVFDNPVIQKKLRDKHIQLLRVNMTQNTSDIEAILKKYRVVAPPSILLFDHGDHWLQNSTLVGEQTPEDFLAAIENL